MRKRVGNATWSLLFIIGSSLIIVSASVWAGDPDVFWHLEVGEWIVAQGSVPRYDVYSWSVYGEPWTAHQWAWEVLMHLLYSRLGIYGLWLLTLVAAVLSGFLVREGLRARGVSHVTASTVGGLAPLLLLGWLKPWPQAGMYVLFSAYLFVSLKGRWSRKDVVVISVVALVWGNIHSTAIMLPLLLLAEVFWCRVFQKVPLQSLKMLLVAALTTGLMTLVNPHGFGLWRYAVGQGLLTAAYRDHITSWKPYIFTLNPLVAIFFVAAVILYFAVKKGKDKDLVFIRALLFWVLALFSRIYTPYAVLSTAAVLGFFDLKLSEKSIMRFAVVSMAVGIITTTYQGFASDLEEVAKERNYPVAAAQVIKEENLEFVFNSHGWGGYLLWEGIPVYIDGRNDVYAEILDEFIGLTRTDQAVGKTIAETGAETVLYPANSTIDLALREAKLWEEYYRDDVAVIYVKKE